MNKNKQSTEDNEILSGHYRKVILGDKTFGVVLYPCLEDGGFWVNCPSLPGCSSQGDTVGEALNMIKDAIKGHLDIEAEKEEQMRIICNLFEKQQVINTSTATELSAIREIVANLIVKDHPDDDLSQ